MAGVCGGVNLNWDLGDFVGISWDYVLVFGVHGLRLEWCMVAEFDLSFLLPERGGIDVG